MPTVRGKSSAKWMVRVSQGDRRNPLSYLEDSTIRLVLAHAGPAYLILLKCRCRNCHANLLAQSFHVDSHILPRWIRLIH